MRSINLSRKYRLRRCIIYSRSVILFSFLLYGISCSAQRELTFESRSVARPDRYDELKVLPDTLVYTFCSNLKAWAEGQHTSPRHFRIKLPPRLLSTYTSGMESFGFRYDDKQVIYVWLDYKDQVSTDTSYRVSGEKEIADLLQGKLNMINDDTRLDIDKNPYNPSRDTWMIRKGNATILLYNINKADSSMFLRYVTSFIFL